MVGIVGAGCVSASSHELFDDPYPQGVVFAGGVEGDAVGKQVHQDGLQHA